MSGLVLDLLELLAARPLPAVDGDKGERGALVVVGGPATCPGAAVLAATAGLRAGAGRVQIACDPSVTGVVGVAVPEALVVGWDSSTVPEVLSSAGAVLIGPGLAEGADDRARAVAAALSEDVPLLLDAGALPAALELAASHHVVVLPNASEAAALAPDAATLARRIGGVVAVRGETTVVADGRAVWSHRGDPGLGASGSGDVLVGFCAGLLARGVDDLAAVAWSVAAHAAAGALLGRSRPLPGYLPRELVDVLPVAVASLGPG